MRIAVAALLLTVVASCVPKPPPAPPPSRTPLPEPAPPPPVLGADWRDWPVTPGTWHYARTGGGSVARFGMPGAAPLLTLGCDPVARQLRLARSGAGATALTIRTTSTTRSVPVAATVTPPAELVATLAATDPLLDAMGFSRGRFVVEQAGVPPLVVPAWAEIERVTEDCRG